MKKILLVVSLIIALISSFGCGNDKSKSNSANQAVITSEASTPEGKIQKSIVDSVDKSKFSSSAISLEKIEINKLDNGYNVNVWAKLNNENVSQSTALSTIRFYAIPVYAGAFTSGQPVLRTTFITRTTLTDGKGNDSLSKVFQSELREKDAASYNWKNQDAIDPDKLGTNVFIHRAIRK